MSYTTLLMDADETLLDFCKSEAYGLKTAFAQYGLTMPENAIILYHDINRVLWQQLERGEIERERLKVIRFEQLFDVVGVKGVDAAAFNRDYMRHLGSKGYMLKGALPLLEDLSKRYTIYIITNGSASVQHVRLKDSGMLAFVKGVFISEEVGADKPSSLYFERVLHAIGDPDKRELLIIGDSLTSDIRGGNGMGIDTCWFNPNGTAYPADIVPTMQVCSFEELRTLLLMS